MRFSVLLVGALLGGCLQADLVDCGDGLLCPAGFVCTPNGCRSPEQLAVCEGITDGTPCTTSIGNGACQDGACSLARCGNGIEEIGEVCDDGNQLGQDGCSGTCTSDESCGNGIVELAEACDCGNAEHSGPASCLDTANGGTICSETCALRRCGDLVVDPGEICDDGNRDAGDGCNFDCTSDETCGNGTLDYFAGELCDDANLRSTDGCSGVCRPEPLTWRQVGGQQPSQTAAPAIAYDSARNRVVMFGGTIGTDQYTAQTWELDGTTWQRIDTQVTPARRQGAFMVYDSYRARIVMWSGFGDAGCLDDTWEYDGVTWTRVMTPVNATRYCNSAFAAYDSARHRVVHVTGTAIWELDGNTWSEMFTVATPSNARIAYDPARNVLVRYDASGNTYELQAGEWVETAIDATPGGGLVLYFDVETQRVVAVGGLNYEEVYEYDGVEWLPRATSLGPDQTSAFGSAYDVARNRLVTFGGRFTNATDQTWVLANNTWTRLVPTAPSGRYGHTMVYDAARARTVLFGGYTITASSSNETWELDEVGWVLRTLPTTRPSTRTSHSMVYDSARAVTVLYGGVSGTVPSPETWEYDGSSWALRASTGPNARVNAGLAYDTTRGRTILFGGSTGSTQYAETWSWNGSAWTQLAPATSPPAGVWVLAYDQGRDRVVAFGGPSADQTWELDGLTWTQRATTGPKRSGAMMSYDTFHHRVLLFGGVDGSTFYGDTWALDTSGWTQLDTPTTSTTRRASGAAGGVVMALVAASRTVGRVRRIVRLAIRPAVTRSAIRRKASLRARAIARPEPRGRPGYSRCLMR